MNWLNKRGIKVDKEVVRQWDKCRQGKITRVDRWTEKPIHRMPPQDRRRQPKQGTTREQGAQRASIGLKVRGRLKEATKREGIWKE